MFGVQGRLHVANVTGLRTYPHHNGSYLGYDPESGEMYKNNDLSNVYGTWDASEGRNVTTEEAYAKALAAADADGDGNGG